MATQKHYRKIQRRYAVAKNLTRRVNDAASCDAAKQAVIKTRQSEINERIRRGTLSIQDIAAAKKWIVDGENAR